MKKLEKCEFCGKDKFKFLFRTIDKNFNVKGHFSLVKCISCGILFLNPQLTLEELKKHYPSEYYSLKKIDKNSFKMRLRKFLYNLYFNQKNKNYFSKLIFSPFLMYLRGTKIMKGKNLLDIGSGSGQFLFEMKKLGLKVNGVEPGEFDEKISKELGLNINKGNLIGVKYPSEAFDLVTMNHVLEHVENPVKTLTEIKRILKKKGEFIVGVPNSRSLAHYLFKKNWYQLDVPRHLFNYSDKILIKYLKIEGFEILRVRYNSRPQQFSVSLIYLLGINHKRKIRLLLDLIFLPLTYVVNILKIGDQIEIYCKK